MEVHVINGTQHYMPAEEQLMPFYKIKCTQPHCASSFVNMGHYDMHLERHHKVLPTRHHQSDTSQQYHCPVDDCAYHFAKRQYGFRSMKYLRQHYLKVHAERRNICEHCGKRFISEVKLLTHAKQYCGRRFVCSVCGWDYESKEALQTHTKRKRHVQTVLKNVENKVDSDNEDDIVQNNTKVATASLTADTIEIASNSSEPQPEMHTDATFPIKRLRTACNASAQTELSSNTVAVSAATTESADVSSSFLEDIHSLLRDMETQTELPTPPKRTAPTSNATCASSGGFLDQMLAQSTHMHTQTACDDFLSELGLADIQTQTNWEAAATSTAAGGSGFAHDELLVSTETQTSFTQCLLDSCAADDGGGAFGSLYTTTQHTQTCETLLEGLFGAQEQDLIGGFQSTYTQT